MNGKRLLVALAIAASLAFAGWAGMCEYADIYYSRYLHYKELGDDRMMVAYHTAWLYAEAECQGEYEPVP